MITIDWDDVALKKALRELKSKVGNDQFIKDSKRAKQEAARPMIAAAKRNVNSRTGLLKSKIGLLDFSKSNDAFIGPVIGKQKLRRSVKTGRKLKRRRKQAVTLPFYAIMVEGGTKHFKGVKYMERAFNATKGDVRRRLTVKIKNLLNQAINRSKQ